MLHAYLRLEVIATNREDSYQQRENLEHLMKEHTRGWPFCCLIAHDTFGSFMKRQIVYKGDRILNT
jgi:hypothetical protein